MVNVMHVGAELSSKTEVLRLFGFQKKMLQQATWRIPQFKKRKVWFATLGDYYNGTTLLGTNSWVDEREMVFL